MKPRLLLALFESQAQGGRRERVCAALREAVRSGQARMGERLPSSRDLAQDLGLSRVTVEAAYAQLETEGYLHRHVGQGSFVAIDMQRAGAARFLHMCQGKALMRLGFALFLGGMDHLPAGQRGQNAAEDIHLPGRVALAQMRGQIERDLSHEAARSARHAHRARRRPPRRIADAGG